jgi:hypothetical protein
MKKPSRKRSSMKGGVVLVDPAMTERNAFSIFITLCTHVRILTDTSRSSLTLHFWGCPPAQSPYRHTRVSHAFRPTSPERRVTQCLVKLLLLHPTQQQIIPRPFVMSNHASDRNDFLLETANSIAAEVNVQYRIYNQSLFPIEGVEPAQCYFSPICPAIINYADNIDMQGLGWFGGMIMNKLQERVPVPRPGEDPAISARRNDRQILTDFFTVAQGLMPTGGGLGIVTMELMSNCTTMHVYLEQPDRTAEQREFMRDLAHIQLLRLGAMGIIHTDCHLHNVMVNTTVRYLPEPYPLGNVFLIDFGAVRMIQPTWNVTAVMTHYPCHTDAGFQARAVVLMQAMQAHNRALLDQARQQIVPDIATVDEFIESTRRGIIARLRNVAPHMVGGDRASLNATKKISLDKFIDMIMNDMNPPVKIDLSDLSLSDLSRRPQSPKKSPLNKSRRPQSPKKSPLNKSRRPQSPKKSPLNKSRRLQSPTSSHSRAR